MSSPVAILAVLVEADLKKANAALAEFEATRRLLRQTGLPYVIESKQLNQLFPPKKKPKEAA